MKLCMFYMCGYIIINIYMVGEFTVIKIDKLGGEIV